MEINFSQLWITFIFFLGSKKFIIQYGFFSQVKNAESLGGNYFWYRGHGGVLSTVRQFYVDSLSLHFFDPDNYFGE